MTLRFICLDNFSAASFESSGLRFCPSVFGNGGFSLVSSLPSAIHGFAVVSLVFCRRQFSALPSGVFSGVFCPVGRRFRARVCFSLITVQSYELFLRYASKCRFFFEKRRFFYKRRHAVTFKKSCFRHFNLKSSYIIY